MPQRVSFMPQRVAFMPQRVAFMPQRVSFMLQRVSFMLRRVDSTPRQAREREPSRAPCGSDAAARGRRRERSDRTRSG